MTLAWSVPLNLTYNSQNWVQDADGINWHFGTDTGFGYGWNLQIGVLRKYALSDGWTTDYFEFRDASGAVYRLNQNSNGIWSSTESVYLWYDSNANKLHFSNGTFWYFGCMSSLGEQDAGDFYPTLIEDSNGNQVTITYDTGIGATWANSSGRITNISDVRGSAYNLTYTAISGAYAPRYLSQITNNLSSGESFTFNYSVPATVTSPISSTYTAEKTVFLTGVTNNATALTTSFSTAASGELSSVTFPYGGHIRWAYGNETYASSRTVREVTSRYLLWDSGIGERTFTFSRDAGDTSRNIPLYRQLTDSQANAVKVWTPSQTTGLITTYNESSASPQTLYRQTLNTWAQDATGNSYISRIQEVTDPTSASPVTRQTDQTLDQYGNVTQSKLYNYSDLTNPARIYNNTYLSGSNYAANYIYNRLLTSTVTAAGTNLTLATNTYDAAAPADAPGITQHDANFNTGYLYRGNVTSSVSFATTRQMSYDITGTVTSTSDGNPNHALSVTTGTATNYAAPTALTTANALTTSMNWDALLNPTRTNGPNTDTTSTAYDTASRPSSTASPYGAVTTYAYSTSAPQVTAATGQHWTQTYFDGLGRTARVAEGNGSTTVSYTDTVYDTCGCTPVGKPYKTSLPYAPGATPGWKTNTYDALGRTLTSVAPDGSSTTTYGYAGNTITVTDAAGKWKKYTTDAFGQLVQVTEQSPNPASEPNHVTTYAYDVLGHLVQAQMPRTIGGSVVTQTRTWAYDPASQWLTQTTTPEAGTTTYTYNADGTLATKTDAKSERIQYSYDTYGRLIQISRGQMVNGNFSENVPQRTTLAYDGTNGGFSANTAGRVSQVSYSAPADGLNFTELYSYHAAGAITAKRLSASGTPLGANTANLDASYSYDSLGNVTSVQYPFAQWTNGSVVTAGPQYNYTYDAMNRIAGMAGPGSQTLVSSVTYGPANQMLQLNASSFTETRTYNANLQLTELVSGANVHFKYNYSATQNNGRITSMQDVVSGETMTYTYDALNRLINAAGAGDPSGAWSQAFQYDGFGNLTQKTGSNAPTNAFLSTDPTTNRLNSGGAGYDAKGNLTAHGTGSFATGYTYDPENRLVGVQPQGGNWAEYGYDAANQRVYQGSFNVSTWSFSNEKIYFYGADGKKLGCWSLSVAGSTYTLTVSQTNLWFAGRLLTPEDRLQSRGKYFPYGEDRTNPNPANPSNDQEKFATYTRDGTTGLDYAYQRYYNSQLGRFHTADPYGASGLFGAPQTANRYSYATGDAVNIDDPSGLSSEGPIPCYAYCSPFPTPIPGPLPQPNQPFQPEGLVRAPIFRITVTGLSKAGAQQNQIISALEQFANNLSNDCANWLSSGKERATVINTIGGLIHTGGQAYVAHGVFSIPSVAAFTGSTGTNLPAGYAAITFNDTGAFFSNKWTIGPNRLTGGTSAADQFIIAHELAHLLNAPGFQSDLGNATAGKSNDQLVQQHCPPK